MSWYKTGTVSVAQNSNAVLGSGTAFIANSRVGDAFRGPDGGWYEVTNIASDTAMSISPNYRGATAAGGSYSLAPMQGYVKDSADALRGLVNTYGAKLAAMGTAAAVDIQTSVTDSTAGRAMLNGAWGWGSVSADNPTDLNTIAVSQKFGVNTGALNIPWAFGSTTVPFAAGSSGIAMTWTTNHQSQIIVNRTAAQVALRRKNAGVWAPDDYFCLYPTGKTFLDVIQGGTGANTAANARSNLGAAASGANSDITSLSGLTTSLSLAQGGTGSAQGRPRFNELGVGLAPTGYAVQGLYLGWNEGGNGQSNFICNRGGGSGGFTFRSVNADNTQTGPAMIYSYSGQLVIPLGAVPPADGGANMGTSAQRWATYYGVTGAINTSDAREKTEVRQLDQAELNAAMALSKEIGGYKWLQSIAEKGEEGARTHIGMTVQRAIEIMAAQGLDPLEYAFICHDEWEAIEEQSQEIIRGNIYSVGELLYENAAHSVFEQYKDFPAFTWEETSRETIITQQGREAGDRYGFRYDQLALFIARGQEERIARLESLIGSNP